ncbi:hypothetical protein [Oceanimonas doudoroffii]|uniref:Uncharacterized protein n=1 Tax=Oceanimonas doudoroffii TaxID=84158 RepID=A0A233RBP4_9GAMM|nr:hypothetical protein [Oceanimonas doudoroffii]OXY80822.1 hypothetical protein B6S08_15450 [Oceanimonas doudoroffii]
MADLIGAAPALTYGNSNTPEPAAGVFPDGQVLPVVLYYQKILNSLFGSALFLRNKLGLYHMEYLVAVT